MSFDPTDIDSVINAMYAMVSGPAERSTARL